MHYNSTLVTVKQEVMKVQDVKKQLANVLLSSHDGGSPTDNMGTLQVSTIPRFRTDTRLISRIGASVTSLSFQYISCPIRRRNVE